MSYLLYATVTFTKPIYFCSLKYVVKIRYVGVIYLFSLQISEDMILVLITMTQSDTPLLGYLVKESPVQLFPVEIKIPKAHELM